MLNAKTCRAKDSYLELVKRFRLRRLRTVSEHQEAVSVLTRVSLRDQGTRDRGIIDYLDMLAGSIDRFERDAKLKLNVSHRDPSDVVRHLIEANGLSISGLAREIGMSQSNLAEMLSGRRAFSKTAIAKLTQRFAIDPKLFF